MKKSFLLILIVLFQIKIYAQKDSIKALDKFRLETNLSQYLYRDCRWKLMLPLKKSQRYMSLMLGYKFGKPEYSSTDSRIIPFVEFAQRVQTWYYGGIGISSKIKKSNRPFWSFDFFYRYNSVDKGFFTHYKGSQDPEDIEFRFFSENRKIFGLLILRNHNVKAFTNKMFTPEITVFYGSGVRFGLSSLYTYSTDYTDVYKAGSISKISTEDPRKRFSRYLIPTLHIGLNIGLTQNY